MEETFLKIGSRIIEVQWNSKFSYVSESYKKWLELHCGLELTEEGKKQAEELESVVCMEYTYPIKINITETSPIDTKQIETTLSLSASDLEKINKHIEENKKTQEREAKYVYGWLSEREIYR